MSIPPVSRRSFVRALPLTVLATPGVVSADADGLPCRGSLGETGEGDPQQRQRPGFSGPLSQEEAAAVATSPMAQEITRIFGQGYPCSEMIFLAALRRFRLPENHLDAAAVFGGGIGKRDLCGLLTGGLMAIGIAAGVKYSDRATVHRIGRAASNAYWDWWLTRGDLHCMGPGTTHENAEEFVRMCQRTALKLESVMQGVVGI